MLDDNELRGEMIVKAERCKPDYEAMIKRIKEKLGRANAFREASLAYFEGRRASGKMAELIGELVTECNMLDREKDSLIESQEKGAEVI